MASCPVRINLIDVLGFGVVFWFMEMLFVNAGISTPLNVRDYVVAVLMKNKYPRRESNP